MAGMRAISAGGRALVVAGAALLLGSLFVLPWFEVSGTRPDLPAGRYGGGGGTGPLDPPLRGPRGGDALPLVRGLGLLPLRGSGAGAATTADRGPGGRRFFPSVPPPLFG